MGICVGDFPKNTFFCSILILSQHKRAEKQGGCTHCSALARLNPGLHQSLTFQGGSAWAPEAQSWKLGRKVNFIWSRCTNHHFLRTLSWQIDRSRLILNFFLAMRHFLIKRSSPTQFKKWETHLRSVNSSDVFFHTKKERTKTYDSVTFLSLHCKLYSNAFRTHYFIQPPSPGSSSQVAPTRNLIRTQRTLSIILMKSDQDATDPFNNPKEIWLGRSGPFQ